MSDAMGTAPSNASIQQWVKDVAALCRPDEVFWCDGSEEEKERLTRVAVECGDLIPLNQQVLPGCYLHRSALNDVARTENLTFVCTEDEGDAGEGTQRRGIDLRIAAGDHHPAVRMKAPGATDEELRAAAKELVRALGIYQSSDGGFGYYDFQTEDRKSVV